MRSLAVAALPVLALVLAGCGGGDDATGADEPAASSSSEPAADDSPEDDLTAAAQSYFGAFFAGNAGTAYDLLSERCQGLFTQADFGSIVQAASTTYGKLDVTIDSVEVDGDRGTVQATTGVPALDEAPSDEPQWVLEGDAWRSDKCDS